MNRTRTELSLFTETNIKRWQSTPRTIAPRPSFISQVDSEQFLRRCGRVIFNLLIAYLVFGGLHILYQILVAFLSGRIQAVVDASRMAH